MTCLAIDNGELPLTVVDLNELPLTVFDLSEPPLTVNDPSELSLTVFDLRRVLVKMTLSFFSPFKETSDPHTHTKNCLL